MEKFFDRQRILYGDRGSSTIHCSRILILATHTLSFEIGRMLLLSGMKQISFFESAPIKITAKDLGTCCMIRDEDIGKDRLTTIVSRLSQSSLSTSFQIVDSIEVSKYNLIIAPSDIFSNIPLSNECRKHKIPFIAADIRGLIGLIFVDVLQYETDNVNCLPYLFHSNILQIKFNSDYSKVILKPSEDISKTSNNTEFQFSNFESNLIFLNNCSAKCKKYGDDLIFLFSSFLMDQSEEHSLENLKNQFIADEWYPVKNGKILEIRPSVSLSYESLDSEQKILEKKIHPHSSSSYTKDYINFLQSDDNLSVDPYLNTVLKATQNVELSPIVGIFGSLIAQEAIKIITKCGHPIYQWFALDFFDLLNPDDLPPCYPESTKSDEDTISRYQSQINLFGESFQEKLQDCRCFVIGAGAIGCEVLKHFAIMGVGSKKGIIYITDNDQIEETNLSRQFLFSVNDIGKFKSNAAHERLKIINKNLNLKSFTDLVSSKTENLFNDQFWSEVDHVISSVDSVEARRYIGLRSKAFNITQHDSGINGLQGNANIYLPFKTLDLSSDMFAGVETTSKVNSCTVKFNPTSLFHLISWSYNQLLRLFSKKSDENQHSSIEQDITEIIDIEGTKDNLELIAITKIVQLSMETDSLYLLYSDPTKWAEELFYNYFNKQISILINSNQYMITNASVVLHYNQDEEIHMEFIRSAANLFRRFIEKGEVFVFDKDDEEMISFIVSSTNLRAQCFNIPIASRNEIKKITGDIVPTSITSASFAASLLCLEFYKSLQTHRLSAKDFTASEFLLTNCYFNRSELIEEDESKLKQTWGINIQQQNPLISDILKTIENLFDESIISLSINIERGSYTIYDVDSKPDTDKELREILQLMNLYTEMKFVHSVSVFFENETEAKISLVIGEENK